MNIIDIISRKQQGLELTDDEISFVVNGYTNEEIPDYQMSAFLMAVYFKGMTDRESTSMALSMRNSGDVLLLGDVKGYKVDKHSTGGVGDKTTLVLGPMLAACGVTFAKMSGRGLGHTGGTIDKLESIPGFETSIDPEEFKAILNKIGIAVVGQSGHLAPADKKIYALRDVTSTVASIPLIASSIMSKKLASGANSILLDVKVGEGAFMKNVDDATKLAELMVQIGRNAGKTMSAIVTEMSIPLGEAVGNTLEVIEAINTLKGTGPKDLEDLCSTIAAYLLMDANLESDFKAAYIKANATLHNMSAFNKFVEMVTEQHGDVSYVLDPTKFELAKNKVYLVSEMEGYVERIAALKIGRAAMVLGAGRRKLGDTIDFGVGIRVLKKPGDFVRAGDPVVEIYHNDTGFDECLRLLSDAFYVSEKKPDVKLIYKVIR